MLLKGVFDLTEEEFNRLTRREYLFMEVLDEARAIVDDVRERGDEAVNKYTREYEGVDIGPEELLVDDSVIADAYEVVDDDVVNAMERAAASLAAFHGAEMRPEMEISEVSEGVMLGWRRVPLASVGVHVPKDVYTAPSAALMSIIPAKVAGVLEVNVCTAPDRDGSVNPATIVAADMAGSDNIYKVGGAQAVAALAFGTETIPAVDKIVGPGDRYVAAAKSLVSSVVDVDFPNRPGELVVLCDDTADPRWVASDLIAQMETDEDAMSMLITSSPRLAEEVKIELEKQADEHPREAIVRSAMRHAAILTANNIDDGVVLVNQLAPQTLELIVEDPLSTLEYIQHAGLICIGGWSPHSARYASGVNYVLPSAGFSRFTSGLNVEHFTKKTFLQKITGFGLLEMREAAETLARLEGMIAHARAIELRFE